MKNKEAAKVVLDFFEGDTKKALLWFQTENPQLGGVSPQHMIDNGKEDKLVKFIMDANDLNKGEPPKEDKKVNEKISDALGVENDVEDQLPALVEEEAEKMLAILEDNEVALDADFEVAREKLLDLMNKGAGALENYLEVAEQSESPRAYEVLAKLIDTLSSLSKDTLELHEKKRKIEGMSEERGGPMSIKDSNVIVATTADVLDQINARKEQ